MYLFYLPNFVTRILIKFIYRIIFMLGEMKKQFNIYIRRYIFFINTTNESRQFYIILFHLYFIFVV